jgi:hypothetical protein
MRSFNQILTSLLLPALALVAFSAQAQHMNSHLNDPNRVQQRVIHLAFLWRAARSRFTR